MKRILLLALCISMGSLMLNAQTEEKKSSRRVKGVRSSSNSIYIGFLGPTVPLSLNYEHIWTKNGIINIGTKLGGFYGEFYKLDELTLANASLEFVFLFGRSKHLFEMGIGWSGHYGSYYSYKQAKTKHYGIPTSNFSMGYRFQNPRGGFFLRAGFTASTVLFFAASDISELAVGNAAVFGFDKLTGEKPSFSLVSIGIGYAFPK